MNTTEKNHSFLGIMLNVLAYLLYSCADGIFKYLGDTYHAIQIMFFTYVFACVPITLYLALSKVPSSMYPKRPKWVFLRCLAAIVSAPMYFYGVSILPLTEVYMIYFVAPAMITVLSIPMLGERIGIYRSIALLLGLTGVIIVLDPKGASGLNMGHIAILISTFCGAMASIIMRKVRYDESPLTMTVYPILSIIVLGLFIMPSYHVPMSLVDTGLLAITGTIYVVAGYLLYLSYTYVEASKVAPILYTQMIWAVLFSAYIFHEAIPETVYYGLPFIMASGILILYRESQNDNAKEVVTKTRWLTNILVPLLRQKKTPQDKK